MAGTVLPTRRGARHQSEAVTWRSILAVYGRAASYLGHLAELGWDKAPTKVRLGIVAAVVALTLWGMAHAAVLAVLLAVLLVVGIAVWHEHHRRDLAQQGGRRRPGLRGVLYPHRGFCLALLGPLVLGTAALAGLPVMLASLAATILAGVILWRCLPEGTELGPDWCQHDELVADIFHPSVLGPWREDKLPRLRFLGPPRTDELGTAVMLALPGISWEALEAKLVPFAARLGVSRRLLTITHPGTDPQGLPYGENVVRIWVGTRRQRKITTSPLMDMERTDWREPVRIGLDLRGRVITALTVDVHTLFVAKTRAGKTWCARILVGWALLDPRVALYVLNGKDKRKDWRAMAPACEMYVAVDDEDSLHRAFDLLEHLRAECKRRKDYADADLTPVVVLLEEWYSVREAARAFGAKPDKDDPNGRDTTLAALDSQAAQLGSVASGYGMHIIGLAQRGTADYVAMGLKANMGQRFVGQVGDTREVGWTIGKVPAELASAQGEFLAQHDEDDAVLMQGDAISDEQWVELCERAIALRRAEGRLPVPPVERTCAVEDVVAESVQTPSAPAVTLEACVLEALQPEGALLSATELLRRMPPEVAPATREAMGARLGKLPHLVEQGWVGSRRGWRLTAGARQALLSDHRRFGADPSVDGSVAASLTAPAVQP